MFVLSVRVGTKLSTTGVALCEVEVGRWWGAAKTIHGRETRQQRADTSSKLSELYELEIMARAAGSTICRGVQYTHD